MREKKDETEIRRLVEAVRVLDAASFRRFLEVLKVELVGSKDRKKLGILYHEAR